jgi:hypothetical protein
LLEGTIDKVTGEFGAEAEGLIGLLAEGAGQAGVIQPLDTDGLANPGILVRDKITTGHHDTGAFMATDKR